MELIKNSEIARISSIIKENGERANSLVASIETIKVIKKDRASNNKVFKEFDTTYKLLKKEYMKEWEAFDQVVKEKIINPHKAYDNQLKEKVGEINFILLEEKKNELKEYFKECIKAYNIDFLEFDNLNLHITLSASIKSLKNEIMNIINKVVEEFKTIKTLPYNKEVFVEYKNSLDLSKSITNVNNRYKQLEELEEVEEEETTVVDEYSQEFTAPIIEEEITVTFTVTATKSKLIELKEYLEREGIDYE